MGGGKPKPAISQSVTDFDIIAVGGVNATALTKHLQTDDLGYNMSIVSQQGKYILPQAYFGVCHGHIEDLKLESGTVSSQVQNWSRIDIGARITKFIPEENKIVMSNGREHTYRALVLAPGFDHSESHIEGLAELAKTPEEEGVFIHTLSDKLRVDRNYYHGWNHNNGDMIVYSPAGPYKGEGNDFYALYYESFLRQDRYHGRSAANARI
jgi:hypothetical protein